MESTSVRALNTEALSKLKRLAVENFYFFAKAVCGFKDLNVRIHKPLCDLLQASPKGGRNRIILPRGWFKTSVGTIAYSLWRAIRSPNIRILLAQNTATNAEAKLRSIRGIIETNELFRALFPELLPTKDCTWTKSSLCINRPNKQQVESTFEAVGINTQVVSRHYNLIIEDDTVAPDLNELGEESLAPSKENIGQAIGWHKLATPLLETIDQDDILVIGTRWFDVDLLSWIGENEVHYNSYVRSCREDESGASSPQGAVVYPERFSETVLQQLEAALGPYMFSCLYYNLPMRASDMIFKPEWFKYYEEHPHRLEIFTTVDVAGDPETQKGKDTDYNVICTTGKDTKSGRIYVLHYWRGRANPGEVLEELFRVVKAWKPLKVGIESIAYQSTFQYWCKERMRQTETFFLVEGISHGKTAKNLRIQGLQPIFSSGTIVLRSWMTSLTNELLAFPLGSHDDLADCLAMQQSFWSMTRAKEVPKAESTHDVMSLDHAIEDILGKRNENKTIIDDVERPAISYSHAFQFN